MPKGHYERSYKVQMPGLKELVEKGWRLPELAKKFGTKPQQVWDRLRREGIPYEWNRGSPMERNFFWRGGKMTSGNYVYVKIPDHPYATKAGYVLEHRLVMEKKLGRYLLPHEVVHHKRGYSNKIGNLALYRSNEHHLAETLKGKCPKWTPDGKRRIMEAVRRKRVRRK